MADINDDVNDTDQDNLSQEEKDLFAQMQSDEGKGAVETPVVPVAAKPAKKPAAKAGGKDPDAALPVEGDGTVNAEAGKTKDKEFVPLATYLEEKTERKDLRDKLNASEERFRTLEARTNLILEKLVPKEPEVKPEPIPDFETDPAGWIAHTMKSTGKELNDVKKELKTLQDEKAQKAERDQNTSVVQGIMNYAVAKENEFKAATPDYDEASAFLLQSRKDELGDMGYGEAEIMQMIQAEKLTIAAQAAQQGKNPAEIVYNIAKRRGFQKKAAPNAGEDGGQQQQEEDEGAVTPAQKLEAARRGAEHAGSLSDTRGNSPSPLTAARLLEMSEADFAKAIETPEGRALLGR